MNDYKPGMKKQLKVSLRPDEVHTICQALATREASISARTDWTPAEKAMATAECTMLLEALSKAAIEAGINIT